MTSDDIPDKPGADTLDLDLFPEHELRRQEVFNSWADPEARRQGPDGCIWFQFDVPVGRARGRRACMTTITE